MEKDKERSEVEVERGGSRKWNEWKAVRERRRQEGKREG